MISDATIAKPCSGTLNSGIALSYFSATTTYIIVPLPVMSESSKPYLAFTIFNASVRIPAKPITHSGPMAITIPKVADSPSERSDAGLFSIMLK
ncbi:MAG TPA: hypothetical protein VMI94_29090 [Bryobacteraceae bacterium]|nr:hypothetical protein [Bryobacteraceae bacterium]